MLGPDAAKLPFQHLKKRKFSFKRMVRHHLFRVFSIVKDIKIENIPGIIGEDD